MVDEVTLKEHYVAQPARFPLAYYRMKRIAHRYRVVRSGSALLYQGEGVPSFLIEGNLAPFGDLSGVDLLFLPVDQAPDALDGFERVGSGSRLVHRTGRLAPLRIDGIEIHQADPRTEAAVIADVINRCYENDYHTEAVIHGYAQADEASLDLWLWAVDICQNRKAGIFITNYDSEMAQADLDWIQLLPEYRHRGIGEALVAETLSRAAKKASLVTVGTSDLRASTFYRKCGFEGVDYVHFQRIGARLLSYQEACRKA